MAGRTTFSIMVKPPGFFFTGGHSSEEELELEEHTYSEDEFDQFFGGEPEGEPEEIKPPEEYQFDDIFGGQDDSPDVFAEEVSCGVFGGQESDFSFDDVFGGGDTLMIQPIEDIDRDFLSRLLH
jgi:hypothetical protein